MYMYYDWYCIHYVIDIAEEKLGNNLGSDTPAWEVILHL